MAVIDVPGFVASIKDHAAEHGFHIHDERHFVETYSLLQSWQVDLHPEKGCGGPVELLLVLDVNPRTLLGFEDAVLEAEDGLPPEGFFFSVEFRWSLNHLKTPPDLLRLALEMAELASPSFPLEIAATDTIPSPTDEPERLITVTCNLKVSLKQIMEGEDILCEEFEHARHISEFLLERVPSWTRAT